MSILKQAESGTPVPDLGGEHGISTATFYNWRAKFGVMDVSLIAKMKDLENENRRLKKMYVDAQMRALIGEEAPAKNNPAASATRDGQGSSSAARCCHQSGLQGVWHQRNMLSVLGQASGRERADRDLAGLVDQQQSELGLWSVLPIFAQRKGTRLESQADLSDLPRAGTEHAH